MSFIRQSLFTTYYWAQSSKKIKSKRNISIFFLHVYIIKKKKILVILFFAHLLRSSHTTLRYVTLFFTTRHPRILNSLCEATPFPSHAQRRRENARIGPTTIPIPVPLFDPFIPRWRGLVPPRDNLTAARWDKRYLGGRRGGGFAVVRGATTPATLPFDSPVCKHWPAMRAQFVHARRKFPRGISETCNIRPRTNDIPGQRWLTVESMCDPTPFDIYFIRQG